MKVMITTFWDYPHVGGVSTHIDMLSKGLRELGHPVAIISRDLATTIGLPLKPEVRQYLQHLQGQATGSQFIKDYEETRYVFRKLLERINFEQFDVIHAHDVVAADIIGQLTNKPLVLTVHGYLANESIADRQVSRGSLEEEYLLELEKGGLERSQGVIAVDSKIRSYIKTRFAYAGRLESMMNFVDVSRFANLNKAQARAKLGINKDAFLIVCPRRLVEKNGVIYAIKAMATVAKNRLAARLLCLGDGPQRAELEEYIRGNGLERWCRLHGSVPNESMADFYGAADAVLVPSVPVEGVEEATSISALEGMASGRPVIASDIGGLKELIDNRNTGILVPPADDGAIAAAITEIYDKADIAHALGEKAAQRVFREHSYIKAAQTVSEFYGGYVS